MYNIVTYGTAAEEARTVDDRARRRRRAATCVALAVLSLGSAAVAQGTLVLLRLHGGH
jgi:hypothetical protein